MSLLNYLSRGRRAATKNIGNYSYREFAALLSMKNYIMAAVMFFSVSAMANSNLNLEVNEEYWLSMRSINSEKTCRTQGGQFIDGVCVAVYSVSISTSENADGTYTIAASEFLKDDNNVGFGFEGTAYVDSRNPNILVFEKVFDRRNGDYSNEVCRLTVEFKNQFVEVNGSVCNNERLWHPGVFRHARFLRN